MFCETLLGYLNCLCQRCEGTERGTVLGLLLASEMRLASPAACDAVDNAWGSLAAADARPGL